MAEIFARTSDHGSNGDLDLLRRPATPMTDAELLQHYIERERIIHAGQRTPGHYRLRELGFILGERPSFARALLAWRANAGPTHGILLQCLEIFPHGRAAKYICCRSDLREP
jgi:hypothetical protein